MTNLKHKSPDVRRARRNRYVAAVKPIKELFGCTTMQAGDHVRKLIVDGEKQKIEIENLKKEAVAANFSADGANREISRLQSALAHREISRLQSALAQANKEIDTLNTQAVEFADTIVALNARIGHLEDPKSDGV